MGKNKAEQRVAKNLKSECRLPVRVEEVEWEQRRAMSDLDVRFGGPVVPLVRRVA